MNDMQNFVTLYSCNARIPGATLNLMRVYTDVSDPTKFSTLELEYYSRPRTSID